MRRSPSAPRPVLSVVIALALTVAMAPAMARAESGWIDDYDVKVVIDPGDGTLHVTESIAEHFTEPRHGIYRDIPTAFDHDETYDRVTPLTVRSVQATAGASADYVIEDLGGGMSRIKIGDPDRTVTGDVIYTIDYELQGALNGFPGHDELYFNAIGANWDVPIREGEVTVVTPSPITDSACFQGPDGSNLPCDGKAKKAKGEDDRVSYGFREIPPFEGVTVVVGFEKGGVPEPQPILRERWSIERAFAVTPTTVGGSGLLALIALAVLGGLLWTRGRDKRFAGGAVAAAYGKSGDTTETVPLGGGGLQPLEFEPPDGIRPGQVGTLIDEKANPLDVTATIIDLAVRGQLSIEEIPKEGWFGKPDWILRSGSGKETWTPDDQELMTYERVLLNGIFRDGPEVKLSDLKMEFAKRLGEVQDSLYADALRRRWFAGRPDKVRGKWTAIGWVVLIASGALTFFLATSTHLGLLGIPLVLAGLLLIVTARFMPSRTPKGTAMVQRVMGFRRFIESPTQEGIARMSERENLFSAYLPYAIVFDLVDKWAKAFEGLDRELTETTTTMVWYVGPGRDAWDDFSKAIDGFTTTASGTMAATPASSGSSGFSGGGGGGGFGGGGGGSW